METESQPNNKQNTLKLEVNPVSVNFTDRLNNILESNLGKNQKILEALNELSTFFHENSLNTRRTLRSKVEKRGINIIQNFLKDVKDMKNSIDNMYNKTLQISETVDDMISRLMQTKSKSNYFHDQSSILQSNRRINCIKQTILQKYLEKFQLENQDIEILSQQDINNDFFTVLDKSQKIHNNCQMLLQSGNQTLALSIIGQMSYLQENAVEFLYKWTQIHCKDIESPKTAFLLSKAMKYFQNRMILFSNLINEYSTTRRAKMVRLFIDAMTTGGSSNSLKPIETYAQDIKRYVSYMLTWLHQYIPTEKEYFVLLLKDCNISKPEIREEIDRGMSNITEGVCNLLSVRIEYIISSSPSPFELFHIMNLLKYYSGTILEELPDCALGKTLKELTEITECAFFNSIQNLVQQTVLEKMETPSSDLMPAVGVTYLLNFMSEILSMTGLSEEKTEFMMRITNCVIEPLLQAVNLNASRLSPVPMAIYILNCITEISNTLVYYTFVNDWLERLQAQAEAQLDTLTSEQASSFVINLNLNLIYNILQAESKSPLSEVPGIDSKNLERFMAKLDLFLSSPYSMMLPQMKHIVDDKYKSKVLQRANEVIIAVYKQLYECVHDPFHKYDNPSTLLPYHPDEVSKTVSTHFKSDTI